MNNSFGKIFRITTFGESHGPAIGVVIDGCPAGVKVDYELMKREMDLRRPGQSNITSARNETDEARILSGTFNDVTTGAPIAIIINNSDQHSSDYENLKEVYRPSHADYTYEKKYSIRDYRGGGRSSARETAARVAAGAIAQMFLNNFDININAFVSQVGKIKIDKDYVLLDFSLIENNSIRCPDNDTASKMIEVIEEAKRKGDTIGGTVSCVISNVPAGIGEPIYNKLHATLSFAMMSINAAHGFDYGGGFTDVEKYGSEMNDQFTIAESKKVKTLTNFSGGIQGGISNGEDIYFRVLFKPVSTLMMEQETVNQNSESIKIKAGGRHDPCVLPRAVPVVKAMAALVLADQLLLNRTSKI
jgi:chorismate synthase